MPEHLPTPQPPSLRGKGGKVPLRLVGEGAGGEVSTENALTLDRMVRAVDLAEGFALFFARCNIPVLRDELMLVATQQLAALGVSVVEVAFEDEPANVRERLAAALAAAEGDTGTPVPIELLAPLQPLAVAEPSAGYGAFAKRAVFVAGLEYGIPFDQPNARILAELNLGRDAFLRDVPHPLVIWLPDYAVTAVARFAPDFWAWRSGVFEFETDESERSAAFEQSTWRDRPWHALTNLTPEARLLRRRQLESLLDDYRDLPADSLVFKERADILADLGRVCAASQNYGEAAVYYNRALAVYRQVNDKGGEAEMFTGLGDKRKALDFYEQALPLQRQVGDRGGEATTLNNIGGVHDALGDKRKALDFYEQALPLRRQVGDRWGESITRYNLVMVYEALGDLQRAEDELKIVVALDEAIEHPDLASDRAALERVRAKRR